MQNINTEISVDPQITVIGPLLRNLKEVLSQEKDHLSSGRVDKLEVFARKKMQALSQIDMYTRNDQDQSLARANEQELKEINKLLQENMQRLNFRIDAIGEITDTIKFAVKEAEGDGTYKAGSFQIRRRS